MPDKQDFFSTFVPLMQRNSMATADKPRIHYIDFMKGLCILFIVVSHTDSTIFALLGKNLNFTLDSFRSPMYYFISGIFFKTYDGLSDFVRKKVNNIIVPLVFFYLAAFVFHWLGQYLPPAQHFYGDFRWSMLWEPLYMRQWDCNVPLWFLVSLFEVNVLYYVLQKHLTSTWIVAVSAILLSVVGYYLSSQQVTVPLVFDTALVGLPYFILGSMLKQHDGLKPNAIDRWGWIALLVVLVIIYPFAQDINIVQRRLPNYFYLYLVPPMSILALFWACKRLPYIPVINYIGRYSIVILCTHYPLIRPIHRAIKTLWLKSGILPELHISIVSVLAIIAVELLLIKLLTRYLPYFTAQKEVFCPGWHLAFKHLKTK